MRILLLADIHGNWPALQAIDEPFDVCLCLGDLVDYGLEPGPCIDWVRQRAHYVVRGNHDHGVAQDVTVASRNGFKYLTSVTRPLSRERLTEDGLRFLSRLPLSRTLTLRDPETREETRYLLVHATPRDPMEEFATPDPAFWARCLEHVDADVICVGHTHQQYALPVGNKLVINPGSVGQPRDGDPRAAYAVIETSEVELKRRDYPVEDTVRVVHESNLPDGAKQMLAAVFRTGAGPQALEKLSSSGSGFGVGGS